MQTVLEQGSIDKPLTFDVGLIQLSFIPVCSLNTCNISVKLCRGFAALHYLGIDFSSNGAWDMHIKKLLDNARKKVNQLHKVISNRNVNLSAHRLLLVQLDLV